MKDACDCVVAIFQISRWIIMSKKEILEELRQNLSWDGPSQNSLSEGPPEAVQSRKVSLWALPFQISPERSC